MFVTVNELMGLPGLPGTVQGLRFTLNKLAGNVPAMMRRREGTKAFEYHVDCLPEQAREIVKAKAARQLLSDAGDATLPVVRSVGVKSREELVLMRQCPALVDRKVNNLTEGQKKIADARMVLAQEVLRLMGTLNCTRKAAVEFIAVESKKGTLPERVQLAAETANARKGSTRRGVGKSSLQQWLSDYMATQHSGERLAIMAPGQPKKVPAEQKAWFEKFQPHYWNHNGPTLREAYRSFTKQWQQDYHDQPAMLAVMPSYDAVCRAKKSLCRYDQVRGRLSGSALKAYEVYQRRDWSTMPVNGAWISDGKSLELKVKHPVHGRPFTPELTMVI